MKTSRNLLSNWLLSFSPCQIFVFNEDFHESKFASAGTMRRFWTICREQGLEPGLVWRNIRNLFMKMTHGSLNFFPTGEDWRCKLSCNTKYSTFFADVGINTDGDAFLYETHVGCPLKSPNEPSDNEMESGMDKVVTRKTRRATWGSIILGNISKFKNGYFSSIRRYIVATLKEKCNNTDRSSFLCKAADDENVLDALASAATESRYACELGLEEVHMSSRDDMGKIISETDRDWYEAYESLGLDKIADYQRGGSCQPWLLQHYWSAHESPSKFNETCEKVPNMGAECHEKFSMAQEFAG